MRALIVLPLAFFLCSFGACDPPRPDAPPIPASQPEALSAIPPPAKDKDGKVDPLEQAKYDAQRYAELAAQAEVRYEVMKKQAYDDQLRAQVMWITGLALLFAALAGVAAFLVPVGKKTLVAAAVGLVTIAACAQAFRVAVPYLPWIGGALLVGGGLWAAVNWRRLGDAVRNAAGHGDRLEDWLRSDLLPKLDDQARALFEQTVSAAKEEAKRQAEDLKVHGALQHLRGKTPGLWARVTGTGG